MDLTLIWSYTLKLKTEMLATGKLYKTVVIYKNQWTKISDYQTQQIIRQLFKTDHFPDNGAI